MNRIFLSAMIVLVILVASYPLLTYTWDLAIAAMIGLAFLEYGCREAVRQHPDATFPMATPIRVFGAIILISSICVPLLHPFLF